MRPNDNYIKLNMTVHRIYALYIATEVIISRYLFKKSTKVFQATYRLQDETIKHFAFLKFS